MAQRRTERKHQSKAAKEPALSSSWEPHTSAQQLRAHPGHHWTASNTSCTFQSRQLPTAVATPHTAPTPLSSYPSTTTSSSGQTVQKTKEEGGGKWFQRKTLTFSGDCWSSVVGVAGLLPSLVLRFFLVPAVAPGLFFCWYSFSCEQKKTNLKSKQNMPSITPKKPSKLTSLVKIQIKCKDKRNAPPWIYQYGRKTGIKISPEKAKVKTKVMGLWQEL